MPLAPSRCATGLSGKAMLYDIPSSIILGVPSRRKRKKRRKINRARRSLSTFVFVVVERRDPVESAPELSQQRCLVGTRGIYDWPVGDNHIAEIPSRRIARKTSSLFLHRLRPSRKTRNTIWSQREAPRAPQLAWKPFASVPLAENPPRKGEPKPWSGSHGRCSRTSAALSRITSYPESAALYPASSYRRFRVSRRRVISLALDFSNL